MPPKKMFNKPLSVLYTQSQVEYIIAEAARRGVTKAVIIREAINKYMEEHDGREGVISKTASV